MTRLPSVTPRNLGDFVSQVLQNQQELQSVGQTPLERQLTNLQGGVQVSNMPEQFQQLIQQDRQLGGGGVQAATIHNPFTRDDLTPGQQRQAANEIARQQGTTPFFATDTEPLPPDTEVGFQQGGRSVRTPSVEQSRVTNAAQEAMQMVAPLARAGVLGANDVRSIAKSSALNAVVDTQDRSKARRQVRAAVEQYQAGRLNLQQLTSVKEQLARDFGAPTLHSIPEYAVIDGSESQFQEQVAQQIQTKAQSYNLPQEAFTFDPKSGRVVRNTEWFEIQNYQTEQATQRAKPIQEAIEGQRTAALKTFDIGMRNLSKEVDLVARDDPNAARQFYNQASKMLYNNYQRAIGNVQPPPAAGEQPRQPASPVLKHPKLPQGVNLVGAYDTAEQAKASNPPRGAYFTIGGSLVRRRLDGTFEKVQ